MSRDVNPVCECNRPPPAPKHPGAALLRSRHSLHRNQHVPDASGCAMHSRCDCLKCLENGPLRTPKRKRPRVVNPRAFALPRGDRGDRPPVCRRSVDGLAFVAQSRRGRAQTAALGLQCVALGDVGDGVHGNRLTRKVCGATKVAQVTHSLKRMQDRSSGNERSYAMQPANQHRRINATTARAASTRDRAVWVARSRPDAGCRPGTRCGRSRWVPAGTAATRRRAALPARCSCR